MADANYIATLKSITVPEGMGDSRQFVDFLIAAAERNEPTQTPEEAIEAIKRLLALSTASQLEAINAIGYIEGRLNVITESVNQVIAKVNMGG